MIPWVCVPNERRSGTSTILLRVQSWERRCSRPRTSNHPGGLHRLVGRIWIVLPELSMHETVPQGVEFGEEWECAPADEDIAIGENLHATIVPRQKTTIWSRPGPYEPYRIRGSVDRYEHATGLWFRCVCNGPVNQWRLRVYRAF